MEAPTLTDFLLARIAEDEDRHGHYKVQPSDYGDFDTPDGGCVPCDIRPPGRCRVLAECEAKRRIVEWCGERQQIWVGSMCDDPTDPAHYVPGPLAHPSDAPVLRMLALPYADHPSYRQEWKP